MICKHCWIEFEKNTCPSCGCSANKVKLTNRNYMHYFLKYHDLSIFLAAKILEAPIIKVFAWRYLFIKPSKRYIKKINQMLPAQRFIIRKVPKSEKVIDFERVQHKRLLKELGYYDDDFRGIDEAKLHTQQNDIE